ncbi:MAG: cytochrome c oxidase accessory protein CcoG [Leptospiraceae bacterium]|nr:cytochrome c oxidase accessory protein CcoG [Leptospiraceae bacterium]
MIVARKILGYYGKFRYYVRLGLIIFYLAMPWFNWGDRPLILLDIEHRKFFFPGAVFWPQENYFLLLIMLILGISLFFFTSLMGRLWCGWACPQTIFTEMFDAMGRLLSPRFGKASHALWEKVILHLVWFLTAIILTYHFVAYFVGARAMLADLINLGTAVMADRTWPYFLLAIAGLFYFDLAILRHHFCVYICPYARFQSVMLDEDSVVIGYDSHRGEPRRKKKIKAGSAEEADWGDCTNCNKCVQVCPTGIDIRDGLQVACINCTHCVDACAEEMQRYDKATLVDFNSMNFLDHRKQTRFIRPRVIVYATIFVVVVVTLVTLLSIRIPIYASVLRDRNVQPIVVNNVAQNLYEVSLGNATEEPVALKIDVQLKRDSDRALVDNFRILGEQSLQMEPNELKKIRIMLQGDLKSAQAAKKIVPAVFSITNPHTGKTVQKQTIFTIPVGG